MATTLNIVGFEAIPAPSSLSGRIASTVEEARSIYSDSEFKRSEADSLLIDVCAHIRPLADILELVKESKTMTQEQAVRVFFGGENTISAEFTPADISKSDCTQWANAAFAVRDMNPPSSVMESGRQGLSEYCRHYRDLEKVALAAQSDIGNGSGHVAKENAREVVEDLAADIKERLETIEGSVAMAVSDVITEVGCEYVGALETNEKSADVCEKLIKKNASLAKRVRKNQEPSKGSGKGSKSSAGDDLLNDQSVAAFIDARIQTPEGKAKLYAQIERTLGRNGAAQFYADGDASLNG